MVGRCLEEGISLTATTALDEKLLLPVAVEVHDEFPREGIIDGGTYGYLDDLVLTITARGAVSTTTAPACRDDVALIAQVEEGPVVLIGADIDVTTTTAIPAVRAALGDVLLSTEVRRASAALT